MINPDAVTDNGTNMSHTGCKHPKVEIPDPLGVSDLPFQVDTRIAPLVARMGDLGPSFACEDPLQSGAAEFVFLERSTAVDFIAELADFGRSGEFHVAYRRDEVSVLFPVEWVDGLAERYRRFWERRDVAARAAANSEPRERRAPHPTVVMDGIKIDAVLAPLIRLLWDAGVKTSMCCQEREPGICWIRFPSRDDALSFFIPASAMIRDCHWSVDDQHEIGDDFVANPLRCVSVEFLREDLEALVRHWKPGAGDSRVKLPPA
jgi:hypothetical protein